MERKEAITTSNPLGICGKIFNALKINLMLQPFRRISYSPQPVAAAVSPQLPTADSGTKVVSAKTKLPASVKSEPITSTPHAQVPEKRGVAEVGPIVKKPSPPPLQLSSTEERVKPTVPPLTTQETGQAAKVATKVESMPPPVSVGEKEKPMASVAGQGKAKVATKAAPPPVSVQEKGKLMTKVEAAAPTASAGGQGRAKVATKVGPTPNPAPIRKGSRVSGTEAGV